ncbi:hypothetical protein DFH06DRAFT_1152214 [Mycena polygramma]|nr:hypothetical protein DFH06DRAFT_1152214 [Mycena polygramma]
MTSDMPYLKLIAFILGSLTQVALECLWHCVAVKTSTFKRKSDARFAMRARFLPTLPPRRAARRPRARRLRSLGVRNTHAPLSRPHRAGRMRTARRADAAVRGCTLRASVIRGVKHEHDYARAIRVQHTPPPRAAQPLLDSDLRPLRIASRAQLDAWDRPPPRARANRRSCASTPRCARSESPASRAGCVRRACTSTQSVRTHPTPRAVRYASPRTGVGTSWPRRRVQCATDSASVRVAARFERVRVRGRHGGGVGAPGARWRQGRAARRTGAGLRERAAGTRREGKRKTHLMRCSDMERLAVGVEVAGEGAGRGSLERNVQVSKASGEGTDSDERASRDWREFFCGSFEIRVSPGCVDSNLQAKEKTLGARYGARLAGGSPGGAREEGERRERAQVGELRCGRNQQLSGCGSIQTAVHKFSVRIVMREESTSAMKRMERELTEYTQVVVVEEEKKLEVALSHHARPCWTLVTLYVGQIAIYNTVSLQDILTLQKGVQSSLRHGYWLGKFKLRSGSRVLLPSGQDFLERRVKNRLLSTLFCRQVGLIAGGILAVASIQLQTFREFRFCILGRP